uniref:E3 ubiquitin-protein ligase n=1 Tax=Heterorhabditis bacteriophora TaxID=37862 RepID=A0A1I7X2K5_HETBA
MWFGYNLLAYGKIMQKYAGENHLNALTREPLSWRPFVLLDLPEKYDTLFSRYFHRPCINCDKVPQYPLVCLLCSQLVCLDDCCRVPSITVHEHQRPAPSNEVERHTMDCGSGICCYVALNSSLMVVVREKMAKLWGSVYLDIHGEEDRNLRRGKNIM